MYSDYPGYPEIEKHEHDLWNYSRDNRLVDLYDQSQHIDKGVRFIGYKVEELVRIGKSLQVMVGIFLAFLFLWEFLSFGALYMREHQSAD